MERQQGDIKRQQDERKRVKNDIAKKMKKGKNRHGELKGHPGGR